VVKTDKENNLLVVKGAVPGVKGGYLLIRKTKFEPLKSKGESKPSEEKKQEEKKKE
jgi:ribosomal protein L3